MASVRSLRTLGFILFLIASPIALLAADGRISGTVKRADGSPIAGVIVQAAGTGSAVLTDATGSFLLEGLAPGTYTVAFSAGEFASNETVEVRSNQTSRLDKVVDWRISIAETITVTSASRRPERIVEAPSAISVAAEETIAAAAPSGQAPRIIENAPGVDFTQSGLYDFNFNTRGFNSSLNRRILTLIDGRDPSVPFLGAQEWAALSYPIDEMASVELIRGPGSALYGANAFSGVLNMTTKAPRNSPGGRLMLTGGDLNTRRADARHAGEIGGGWYYRVTGGFQQSDDYTVSRVGGSEYADPFGVRPPAELSPLALDEVQTAFGGIRFDKHFESSNVFTAEGGYAELEGPTFVTGIGRVQVVDVAHPWARLNYNARHFNGLAYYDARQADQQVALSSGAPLTEDSWNIHGELQTNWEFMQDRVRLVGGVAYNQQEVDTSGTLMAQVVEEESQAAFGQVTWDVTPKLALVAAGRYDDSNLYETQISPKAAIVYSITPNHTIRYGYNEAFQRPNYSELFLRAAAGAPVNLAAAAAGNPQAAPLAPALTQLGFNNLAILARGNSALEVETVKSNEVGYSGILGGGKAYVTVDYYQSALSNFVTDLLPGVNQAQFPAYQIPAALPAAVRAGLANFFGAALQANAAGLTTLPDGRPALVLSYANAGEVDTQGVEFGLNYYLTNNWLIDANYAWFDFEVQDQLAGDALLPNSPENKYNLGLSFRSQAFDARLGYRWVEEFPWAAGIFKGTVPEYDLVNLSAQYRFNNVIGFGVDVSNVLDNEHYEAFGGDLLERRALGFVTLNW